MEDIFRYEISKYADFTELYNYNLTLTQWLSLIPTSVKEMFDILAVKVSKKMMDNYSRGLYLLNKYLLSKSNDRFAYFNNTRHTILISNLIEESSREVPEYLDQMLESIQSKRFESNIQLIRLINGNYNIQILNPEVFDVSINEDVFAWHFLFILYSFGLISPSGREESFYDIENRFEVVLKEMGR